MEEIKEREMALLRTMKGKKYWDAELTMGINGQKGLQAKQLFTMEKMYKHWNNWRVRLGVWIINSTKFQ